MFARCVCVCVTVCVRNFLLVPVRACGLRARAVFAVVCPLLLGRCSERNESKPTLIIIVLWRNQRKKR